jgi:hypothetical protein
MAEIFHLVPINAKAEIIYEALTSQKGLSNWWLPDVTSKAEIGYVNIFKVGSKFVNKMKITELVPFKKVSWLCENEGKDDEWCGTRILFVIETKENGCLLSFRHADWKKASSFFGNCSFHWARHLIMLKHYCETGESILDAQSERNLADSALKHL